MKILIAGICGTFMAGIAQLARASGHDVYGCDAKTYPPMSTLLDRLGIRVKQNYCAHHIEPDTDHIIIGNALSRGNPLVESVLDRKLGFQSGPQWLHDHVLKQRQVIAVAGTHGKTSTASMLSWILDINGFSPGFLIGGQPGNFAHSARLGTGMPFVIEADEYDTAFFDKRSKFIHYAPEIVVLNNLEFDHADIFSDLAQIKTQFHHLIRIVPSRGCVLVNADDPSLQDVLRSGCWSQQSFFSISSPECEWYAQAVTADCSEFEIFRHQQPRGTVQWNCIGRHNMQNALAAVVAADRLGLSPPRSLIALATYQPAARRLQQLYSDHTLSVYEDFAHHPTAIRLTIEAVKAKYPDRHVTAVVEPKSNTMRMGHHGQTLGAALGTADTAIIYSTEPLDWIPQEVTTETTLLVYHEKAKLLAALGLRIRKNSVILCMSNGSFEDIPIRIKELCNSFALSVSYNESDQST